MSSKANRKPSVAMSRRFSCTDALNVQHRKTKSSKHQKGAGQHQKIMRNGIDVTPLPLSGRKGKNSIDYSLEDVSFLREGSKDGTEVPKELESFSWIMDVMKKDYGGNDKSPTSVLIPTKEENVQTQETGSNNAGSAVANDDPNYAHVKERNAAYEQACNRRREFTEKFCDGSAQTFHRSQRVKCTMTPMKVTRDVGCCFSDEHNTDSKGYNEEYLEKLTKALVMIDGCLVDVSDGLNPASFDVKSTMTASDQRSIEGIMNFQTKMDIFQSSNFRKSLRLVERAIQQNRHAQNQIKYRGVPLFNEASKNTPRNTNEEKQPPVLEHLFSLKCEESAGRRITSLSWHKSNTDVLAVGCGNNRNNEFTDGTVMLFSLRNPSYPESTIRTDSPVTALDFSSDRPSILAAGLSDGRVVVFDTTRHESESAPPIYDSASTRGRHMLPVFELRWVDSKSPERNEKLLSISSDGRVLQWSLAKKGLSVTKVMTLKRDAKHKKGKLYSNALGLCMDFPYQDEPMVYVAGSDDGSFYKCSRSYTEQHLAIVKGHDGPLTKIRYSPFLDSAFLTASADWSMKLWSVSKQHDTIREAFEFRPLDLTAAVNDIAWSPQSSTIFSTAAADGRLEIWDLSKSTLDPILIEGNNKGKSNRSPPQPTERTCVLFCKTDPVLVVGDNKGTVEVYSISSLMNRREVVGDAETERNRLMDILGVK